MRLPRSTRLRRRLTLAPREPGRGQVSPAGRPQRVGPQRVPPPPPAHTGAEIERATAGLEAADLKRLRAVARVLIGPNVDSAGRDYDDLVSEAVLRTLQGSRAWCRGVDFLHHLAQAMRSVAFEWRQQGQRRAEAGLVPLPESPSGGDDLGQGLVESAPSLDPGAEARAITRDRLRAMVEAFEDDRAASVVLEGWAAGRKGPEIRRRHGMSEKELRAAMRRIRRFAQLGEP